MKKIYTLLLLFTITLFYNIPTQAYDIPLNYGVSDNDQAFVQTKNLFDKDVADWVFDEFYLVNGNISVGVGAARLNNYIQINPNTTYTFSSTTSINFQRIIYYTNANTFISALTPTATTVTFTTPINAGFIRFHVTAPTPLSNLDTIQLELGSTATSYAPYGFLSLNDIFLDGQLLLNPNFDTTATNWSLRSNTSQNVSDGVNTITATATGTSIGISQTITGLTSNKIYVKIRYKPESSNNLFVGDGGAGFSFSVVSNFWQTSSGLRITTDNEMRIYQSMTIGQTIQIDYMYAYNTNNLGIDHLSKFVLDSLYDDWFYNSIYDQGFTDGELSTEAYANGFTAGYEVGYGDGYTDAVEEDNAYALGFAKGLLEGTDMETGSSLLILIVAAIGFIMMIFGFATKRRIFNLLSVGAFIVLGGLLAEFVGFIIITVGLVFVNVYYTFFGDI